MARVLVVGRDALAFRRAGRTLRALRTRGVDPIDATAEDDKSLSARLREGPAWLVRAGAFPVERADAIMFPPPSATGRPLLALGAVRSSATSGGEAARAWDAVLAATGGDLSTLPGGAPPLASVFADARAAAAIADRIEAGGSIEGAVGAILVDGNTRSVRYAPLDVHDDDRLRAVLAITSLQQGGAERVVLDLFEELGAEDVTPIVVALGRPTRAAYPSPPGTIDLARSRDRIAALVEEATALGADLIHVHLLGREEVSRLSRAGIPLLLTIHNTRPGWPEGLGDLAAGDAALLVACSLAAEADLAEAEIPIARRTIWNGIDAAPFADAAALRAEGAAFRAAHGLGPSDLVLLAVANPRPQKRLHLLPAVLAAADAELARRGTGRAAHLVIAGDADPRTEAAARSARELDEAVRAHGLAARVHRVGSLARIAPALGAADALVSVSAHEGLSLAHLEALAAGLPLVATGAGGTAELARDNPAACVLPIDVAPERFAERAVDLALRRPEGGRAAMLASFSREGMARRYASTYRRVLAFGRRGRGIALITNNLSTGGAQSSARRLLLGLAAEGVAARAIVLEEQPAYPTPGRSALLAAGIPVTAVPPPGSIDVAAAVELVLDDLDADPPAAVVFWNALAEHKVRLADALLDVPVFDVSPGEMYFASLARWFSRARPGLPYLDARAYGARLAGVIVKYEAESAQAAEVLGAKVHVVPNGVDLGPPPAARSPGSRLVIGTLARLSPQKKLEDLLDALRLARPDLPPHVLWIAGGPERGGEAYAAELRRRAEGLDVEWLGNRDDARSLLGAMDLFAMVSEPAGCPNASLEAMAAGLPIVATDVGGASEQIVDGVNGRLVARGDARAFARALVELGNDADQRRAMGAAGRARAEARFGAGRMIGDYRRILLGG